MKVTLKEGRRIERRIQDKLTKGTYSLDAQVSVYSDIDLELEYDTLCLNATQGIEDSVNLIETRILIRRKIQEMNESSGINSIISTREGLSRVYQLYQDVLSCNNDVQSFNILHKIVENKIKRLETSDSASAGLHGRSDIVEFIPMTQEGMNDIETSLSEVRRTIDKCDDDLSALNANTTIFISDEMVTFLTEQKIL